MEYCEFAPPGVLRPYVRCLWTLTAAAGSACIEPIVPDGCMELVVHWGDRFASVSVDGTSTLQERAVIVGEIRSPFHVVPTGGVGVVAARFRIGGAGPWLRGRSAGSLTETQVGVDDLWSNAATELVERVALAPDARTRAEFLARWLLDHMRGDQAHPSIPAAADWFDRYRGRRGVDALSAHLGLGPRQLQRLFAEHVGLPPKTIGRIVRFQSFLCASRTTPAATCADLAVRSGYADQAHLIRDFREFAGTTPRAWLAQRTPIAAALAGF